MSQYDVIIVGAGFAGSIMAERFSSVLGQKVLLIEQRDHIAGNMYDYKDSNGILVHKYGPHLFRTSNDRVRDYIAQFTQWYPYQHRVLASVHDQLVPVPFNLTSIETLLPEQADELKTLLLQEFGMDVKVPVSVLRKHQDVRLQQLGEFIFENIYLNYTTKQWGDKPENLDFETITARVPVHISYDDRYFQESHQALCRDGYTKMFEKMLANPLITVRLQCRAADLIRLDMATKQIFFEGEVFSGQLIYTGALDDLFDFQFGALPYRSLRFELESHDLDYYQPTGTVNYPNSEAFTRITEYKHMMAEKPAGTTIMKEYPQDYDRHDPTKNIPYYPIPKDENTVLYQQYQQLAQQFAAITLVGRLAEYRYYDMNNIIIRSLELFDQKFKGGI